jgi:hypothetical protein
MTRHETAMVLTNTIRSSLLAYPDLLDVAIAAISNGMADAFEKQREQLANTQLAMSLSLSLLPPNRINDATRKHLEMVVLKAIPLNRTPAEQRFVETMEK